MGRERGGRTGGREEGVGAIVGRARELARGGRKGGRGGLGVGERGGKLEGRGGSHVEVFTDISSLRGSLLLRMRALVCKQSEWGE